MIRFMILEYYQANMGTNGTNKSNHNSTIFSNSFSYEDQFAQNIYVRIAYGALLLIIMLVSVAGGLFVSYVIISGRRLSK